jgi:tRNA/rRNA methyltransferase
MQTTFVLVNTAVSQNIGAAARAMNTMGFSDMRLVNPQCNHYDENSWYMAHGSTAVLENARIFPTIQAATQDCDFIIGTTARKRTGSALFVSAKDLYTILVNKQTMIHRVALTFGSESHGMTNADLSLCNCVSTVPLQKKYPSLNLSQAVMIYAYELSAIPVQTIVDPQQESLQYAALARKVADLLTQVGLPAWSGVQRRVVKQMAMMTAKDLHCIHSICNKFQDSLQRCSSQLKSR